ncbi:DMT family transporter [Marininema halotolerans]|uniref:Permease of the drug/metabolite transporter (DMT) superfamily n=1 Tax=Marininema halotolerans TaxID=1155944 RepID=A0A1I6TKG9_9BACL|nr:DMT family transporter [Marininema halotolerans]SFS89621.1 Permease of the drug/metabolite transporter (DMT) superfamily [Marininema halotolerans]
MNQGEKGSVSLTYSLLGLMSIFWGSAFVGSKMVVGVVPPTVAAFIRFGLGGLMMGLYLLVRGRGRYAPIPRQRWFSIALLGIIGVTIFNACVFLGLDYATAADATMMIPTLSPVITVILTVLFLKGSLTGKQGIGLSVAILGSLIFFVGINSSGEIAPQRLLGDGILLIAAICWSIYTTVGSRVLAGLDPFLVTACSLLLGSSILGVIAWPSFSTVEWESLGWQFWALQGYLALFPTVLSNWFYYRGIQHVGPSRAAVFMYFVPISGLMLCWLILDEKLGPIQLFGSGLLIVGVWLVNRGPKKSKKPLVIKEAA